MWCGHCVTELRTLLQEARDLADSGFTLAAVSSTPVADPDGAIKLLKVPAGLAVNTLRKTCHRFPRTTAALVRRERAWSEPIGPRCR
jgi:hypothetical protein